MQSDCEKRPELPRNFLIERPPVLQSQDCGEMFIYDKYCMQVLSMYVVRIRQKGNLHWNLNFAISLNAISLNLNSAYYYIFRNLSMIVYN